jgi:hypothetical protein
MPPKLSKQPKKGRKPLRRMSEKKSDWMDLYLPAVEAARKKQIDLNGKSFCEKCLMDGPVEPHHIYGRNGSNLMRFKLIGTVFGCGCHRKIHDNSNQARKEGWLKYEEAAEKTAPDNLQSAPRGDKTP